MSEIRSLLDECERTGVQLTVENGRLRIAPAPSLDLLSRLKVHREELIELVCKASQQSPSSLEGLRRFAPSLWNTVRTVDGRIGVLWGVHARGVVVSFDPATPLLTLDPADLLP